MERLPRAEWDARLEAAADAEVAANEQGAGGDGSTPMQELQAGVESFVHYLVRPPDLRCDELMNALEDSDVRCPRVDSTYVATLAKKMGVVA